MAAKKLLYSEAISEIESILMELENGEPDVDHLSEKVKRVNYLIQFCKDTLSKTESEIEMTINKSN